MRTPYDAELQDRLIRYAAVDTQSDENSPSQPSTACQLDLSRMLVAELEAMGASDVRRLTSRSGNTQYVPEPPDVLIASNRALGEMLTSREPI